MFIGTIQNDFLETWGFSDYPPLLSLSNGCFSYYCTLFVHSKSFNSYCTTPPPAGAK